jgi:hypothetical protein
MTEPDSFEPVTQTDIEPQPSTHGTYRCVHGS